MKFSIGRNNLAATVYVPYDCKNNCPFCTSKKEYSKFKMDEDAVKEALRKLVNNPDITDVVFTGGEPTANPDLLQELVTIAKDKNVFINTTLPRENFFRCLEIFNGGYVDGVNISRHSSTFAKDSKIFHNIVDDWVIEGIQIPVKINVVLADNASTQEVDECIARWKGFDNITISFRRDFRKITPATLHMLSGDSILDHLVDKHPFIAHTYCDVCDTVQFSPNITFHRGLEKSSIQIGNNVIVNDIIVFPDGFIAYDWDRKPISDLDNFMPKNKLSNNTSGISTGCGHVSQPVTPNAGGSCGMAHHCGYGSAVVYKTPRYSSSGSCGGGGRC